MTQPIEGSHDASALRGVIVVSRFNESVTEPLLDGALACLKQLGAASEDCRVLRVPGAWELPLALDVALATGPDYAVALGTLIRGETYHFELLSDTVGRALSEIALRRGVPIGMGLLTVETREQAVARAAGGSTNKGWEAARAAVEMAQLLRRVG